VITKKGKEGGDYCDCYASWMGISAASLTVIALNAYEAIIEETNPTVIPKRNAKATHRLPRESSAKDKITSVNTAARMIVYLAKEMKNCERNIELI